MSIAVEHGITEDAIHKALSKVQDPEIHRSITELDMVKEVHVAADGTVKVAIFLTVAGCPMKDRLTNDIKHEVGTIDGVTAVEVELDVMSSEQRDALKTKLRGGQVEREIPFAQAGSLTRVYAIASGKGGVGKSSVTVNLAAALAAKGLKVGVVDADIYGHSIPRMLGVTEPPTPIDDMILAPTAPSGVKVISIGMFTPGNSPVVWRGPMLHRAIQQFLGDVYWGDLDVLLLDLPPGTGDIAISVAQLVPNAEILVVTTPQQAAAEVAERAGTIAVQTRQRITGVIENMSWMPCPHCGEQVDVFGSGGGQTVAEALTRATGTKVPVLGQIPIDVRLREGGDNGQPLTVSAPRLPRGAGPDRHRRQDRHPQPRPGRHVPRRLPGPQVAPRSAATSGLTACHDAGMRSAPRSARNSQPASAPAEASAHAGQQPALEGVAGRMFGGTPAVIKHLVAGPGADDRFAREVAALEAASSRQPADSPCGRLRMRGSPSGCGRRCSNAGRGSSRFPRTSPSAPFFRRERCRPPLPTPLRPDARERVSKPETVSPCVLVA